VCREEESEESEELMERGEVRGTDDLLFCPGGQAITCPLSHWTRAPSHATQETRSVKDALLPYTGT
jgi:hypothetical protein